MRAHLETDSPQTTLRSYEWETVSSVLRPADRVPARIVHDYLQAENLRPYFGKGVRNALTSQAGKAGAHLDIAGIGDPETVDSVGSELEKAAEDGTLLGAFDKPTVNIRLQPKYNSDRLHRVPGTYAVRAHPERTGIPGLVEAGMRRLGFNGNTPGTIDLYVLTRNAAETHFSRSTDGVIMRS